MKKAPLRNALFLVLAALLFACGNEQMSPKMVVAEVAVADRGFSSPASGSEEPGIPTDRRIIRSGELRLEVTDLDVARDAVLRQVEQAKGYVESDQRDDHGYQRSVTLTVRVPAAGFDAFLDGAQGLGKLLNRNINAQDVTDTWVDTDARLKAKRTLEERYLELSKQARTVPELLEVEQALGNVRAEIESLEARMQSLRARVGMSTLTITCVEPRTVSDRYAPDFGSALRGGWDNLVRFVVGLVHLWPFVLLACGLVWWWRKKRRSTKS